MSSKSRPSAPRTPPAQRPKLMRAAATAPSLATSVASRNDCSAYTYHSSAASTLLSRVANFSGKYSSASPHSEVAITSPGSAMSSPESSPNGHGKGPYSGAYFSFPSFEDFHHHDYTSQDEKAVRPD